MSLFSSTARSNIFTFTSDVYDEYFRILGDDAFYLSSYPSFSILGYHRHTLNFGKEYEIVMNVTCVREESSRESFNGDDIPDLHYGLLFISDNDGPARI